MNLIDIVNRPLNPAPWAEGEKIPWDEPEFSARMLHEHLSQKHDAASRRFSTIDQHVAWLHHTILASRPSHILDLGCGPGLYTSRLAQFGHTCLGIDFSPASIAYAQASAAALQQRCRYLQQDLRRADFGQGYDLIMLIYGELNTFRPNDAKRILQKAQQALAPNGQLVLEVHTFEAVQAMGKRPPAWISPISGLFSSQPHLRLSEDFWDDTQNAATRRYIVIDAASGQATRYAASMQAYTRADYHGLLTACGFTDIVFHPALSNQAALVDGDYEVIVCRV